MVGSRTVAVDHDRQRAAERTLQIERTNEQRRLRQTAAATARALAAARRDVTAFRRAMLAAERALQRAEAAEALAEQRHNEAVAALSANQRCADAPVRADGR